MKKLKKLAIILCILILLLVIPSISNAVEEGTEGELQIEVTRNVYSNNGSMKFNFTGLTLDINNEYEFGLTKTSAEQVETWYSVLDFTMTTATVDITTGTQKLKEVINATDTGYITIKNKTADTIVLPPYAVDLKMPYLQVTNYTVLNNGKSFSDNDNIQVVLRNADNSQAYYKYEKITDESIINKYKEIKNSNSDILELQSMLKTNISDSGWTAWDYWNGYTYGVGYSQKNIEVPDTGLYYMWLSFSGENLKPLYGCILVDNLEPYIALEGISLSGPATLPLGVGMLLRLVPIFNPTNATNKNVIWTSSDETIATVDDQGSVTPLKLGSTIITATSVDGNKVATCTVTVTEPSNGNGANGNGANGSTNNGGANSDGTTINTNRLPKTGENVTVLIALVVLVGAGVILYFKNKQYRDIK